MSRRGSAGSIFWGLTLIVAGGIFLARNLGYNVPVWSGIARYWPVLLIVWGLLKLVDYYRWRRSGQTGTLFSGGEVVLLILVIFVGTAITSAANMDPDFGRLFEMADIDLWDITGNTYEYTEHLEQDIPSGSTINVINRHGGVEIAPGETNQIVLDVKKSVIASTQKDADEMSKLLTFSIRGDGSAYNVWSSFNRDENRIRGRRFRTSLTLRVPKGSSLVLDNRNGEVSVSGLTGDQKITNGFGRVTVRGITGSVSVENRNESVLVEDVTGSAKVSNEYSNTAVRNVAGRLELRGRNGTMEVADIKGGASITNQYGSVDVSNVQGALEIHGRNSMVDVDGARDGVTVRTEYENVRVANAGGAVEVQNRNGAVWISFAEPPSKDVKITSQYGDVALEIPENSSFSVDARTRYGEVSSDFSLPASRPDGERNYIVGQVGSGGPDIRIDNRNGSIRIEKR